MSEIANIVCRLRNPLMVMDCVGGPTSGISVGRMDETQARADMAEAADLLEECAAALNQEFPKARL